LSLIVFRCDASNIIGSGHVIRCRTLARELYSRGHEIIFVCRITQGNLIKLLEKEFKVLELIMDELSFEEQKVIQSKKRFILDNQKIIQSQLRDAKLTLKALDAEGIIQPDWIIVDQYELDKCWEEFIQINLKKISFKSFQSSSKTKIMVIDDLANRSHFADLLLDQNFFGFDNLDRYLSLVGKNCIKCFGPFYALLGGEYSSFKNKKIRNSLVKKINVFLGGYDSQNLTGKILKVLTDEEFKNISVDVVQGLQSKNSDEIKMLSNQRKNITVYDSQNSLIKLFSKADLAIGACGSTTWERLFLDLPSFIITIAENQREIAKCLDKENFCKLIGDIDNFKGSDIKKILLKAINTKINLEDGRKIVDGFGVQRIATALVGPQLPIKLRKIHHNDKYILFNWINEPGVRVSSLNSSLIKFDEHENWFNNGLKDKGRYHYIALDSSKFPLGQIRFDTVSLKVLNLDKEFLKYNISKLAFEIDISLEKCARGFGLGKIVLLKGIEMLARKSKKNILFFAKIKKSNHSSIKTFKQAEFKEINHHNNEECNIYFKEQLIN
tara:strand:- start:2377 stop:4038 length:1662 start_codon:yes stop_codon:yes gene_type:complete